MAQRVALVHVFVTQRQREHPLTNQGAEGVLNQISVLLVDEATRQLVDETLGRTSLVPSETRCATYL